ncbi:MAG TPA: glycosyltransferase [Candidatus Limnocylindrales bacterium]
MQRFRMRAAVSAWVNGWREGLELTRDVSVIICAYTLDRWDQLTEALRSAARQAPPPIEVILVVDHNPDLLARARAEFPLVRVVENAGVQGLSGGRNTGLAEASGEIAAFLDDDAEADPGWLSALLAPYEDPNVVATGGKVLPVWETARPGWMPDEFDWVVGCSYRGLPQTEAPVRNPIGCSMSLRRQAAVDAGGFSTEVGRVGTVPAGCEETDLAIRLRRLTPGSRVVYVPSSTVRHHVPAKRARWSYFRSRCYEEGRSKAILSRFEGSSAALSSERSYTTNVLSAGVLRGVGQALRGDLGGAQRAAAILAGLCITALGYVGGVARTTGGQGRNRSASAVRGSVHVTTGSDSAVRVRPPVRRLEIDLERDWPAVAGPSQDPSQAGGIQVLARLHGCPVGLVVAPLPEAGLTPQQLGRLVSPVIAEAVQAHRWRDEQPLEAGLSGGASSAGPRCERMRNALNESGPALDVVIPTHNRPDRLAECVDSVLATGYRRLRVIVVDNDPSGPETADLVAGRADWKPSVEYVLEPRAGSSLARNRGIERTTAGIVAFVDDDVAVDPGWAAGLASAFVDEPEAGCVTGPIVAAELNTQAQMWIEEYGGFAKGFVRRVFDPFDSTAEVPLFPYAAGTYGSGANMAFRRETIREVFGFDPALGIGTPARGGEDLAAFAGAVLSGRRLVYEPSMMVRHRHHPGYEKLRQVILGYGVGLGAYLAKTIYDRPSTLVQVARRIPPGLAYLLSPESPKNSHKSAGYPMELTFRELAGMAWGPFAYGLGRLELRRRRRRRNGPPGRIH